MNRYCCKLPNSPLRIYGNAQYRESRLVPQNLHATQQAAPMTLHVGPSCRDPKSHPEQQQLTYILSEDCTLAFQIASYAPGVRNHSVYRADNKCLARDLLSSEELFRAAR